MSRARLVKAAAQGDEAAWRAIVERFSGLVWAVARSFRLNTADASDVYQTVWLRLAEHLGRIQNPDQVGAWLATTARRESIRVVRGRRRSTPIEDSALADLVPADEISPELAVLEAEQAQPEADRAKQHVARVPRSARSLPAAPANLMASHRPSYAEAAAALDVPVGSIGPTRARCLRQLRRLHGRGIRERIAGSYQEEGPAGGRPCRTSLTTPSLTTPRSKSSYEQIIERLDPVPERLLASALGSYTWRTVDSELAELVLDSVAEDQGALVRAPSRISGCSRSRQAA